MKTTTVVNAIVKMCEWQLNLTHCVFGAYCWDLFIEQTIKSRKSTLIAKQEAFREYRGSRTQLFP